MRQSYSNRHYPYVPIYFRQRFTGVEYELLYYGLMNTRRLQELFCQEPKRFPPKKKGLFFYRAFSGDCHMNSSNIKNIPFIQQNIYKKRQISLSYL